MHRNTKYFYAVDVGGIEILSSKSHRNQDDDRPPGVWERLFTQPPHVLQIDCANKNQRQMRIHVSTSSCLQFQL